jgi:hypothetical protein
MSRILRLTPRALQSTRPFSTRPSLLTAEKDASTLDADKGSVGSAFKSDGAIGSKAQEVGGVFSKDGKVGEKFEKDGAVGGTAEDVAKTAQGEKPSAFDKDGE